ncbi:uracil-DNA glycosylase family protein [Alteromonas facilis]|uniref:uracil-DNA glycosylase family protein n=1 Tax=Alteromonas facilis TaxID=2048004 RepID=UPI000C286640|nr:uracil-DNA glycosylase family protein [Alteromonas facilis]
MSNSGNADQCNQLLAEAHACQLCKDELPYQPRPIFLFSSAAKINLISQAPGKTAHDHQKAWDDPSGNRLRQWLGVTEKQFYTQNGINVLPMGFCFPGYKQGADAAPMKRCAPTWHPRLLAISQPALTIYIGRYAQQYYLPRYPNLTSAIEDWDHLLDTQQLALPHPSGRNNRWLAKHAWFEKRVIPRLRGLVRQLLAG